MLNLGGWTWSCSYFFLNFYNEIFLEQWRFSIINFCVSILILEWIKTVDKSSNPITFMPHMEIAKKVLDIPLSKSESSIIKTKTRTLMLVQLSSV